MKNIFIILCVLFVSTVSTVHSSPLIFFGEDQNIYPGNDVPRIDAYPNSTATANVFRSKINGAQIEDFEALSAGASPPLSVDFGPAGNATLINGDSIFRITDSTDTFDGVFPTSGNQFFWTFAGATTAASFRLEFDDEQSAFGFFGTDFENGDVTLSFESLGGGLSTYSIPFTQPSPSGSVLFFGLIDTSNPFVAVNFQSTNAEEGFGFDDFTIATREQVSVPAPSSALLVLLGIGILLARNQKKARLG